ncbi:ribonuclease T2 family protein [Xanthobacter sp. AM11]|uniref:ribonuclease T2 family protein n=1 Tax=Xanthobacter sp. AM11 TaxID=3380643 RepID=UPI0039BF5C0A
MSAAAVFLRLRGFLFAAAVLLAAAAATLSGTPAHAQQDQPGAFDFYVLALSWSPTYCEDKGAGAADEPQCSVARPYAFVVHGLWPQYERGFPQSCQRPAPYVPGRLVSDMLDVMPSKRLVIHEWKKHGTCSGLSAERYFGLVRAARHKVVVPPEFVRLMDYRTVAPAEVEAAFRAANPGLAPDMLSVECDRRRLTEVRVCLSRELEFRACPDVDRRACRLSRMVMPPVRGAR